MRAIRSTLFVGNDSSALRQALQETLAKRNGGDDVTTHFVPELLLRADAGEAPSLPEFNIFRPEDDNKYEDSLDIPGDHDIWNPQRRRVMVIDNLEYLLMGFISPGALKIVTEWLSKVTEMCEDVDLIVYGTLNCKSLSNSKSEGPTSVKLISGMFRRLVEIETDTFSLEAMMQKLQEHPLSFQEFWNDSKHALIGYNDVKHELERLVRWRWHKLGEITEMGIRPSPGILLCGPSGCGKTKFAQHLGREEGVTFIEVKASDVFSKWFGDSEKAIREVFTKARASRPCILFMDEIESLAPERSSQTSEALANGVNVRVLSTLLNELDGVDSDNQGLVVIGATCNMSDVDRALIRPGRLGSIIQIDLPTEEDRLMLFEHFLTNAKVTSDIQVGKLVQATNGYTVAKIESACKAAAYLALWDEADHIEVRHLDQALSPFFNLV